MLRRPEAEWDAVARAMLGAVVLLRSFLLPQALLAPTVTIIGMLIFDTGWNPEYGCSMARDRGTKVALGIHVF